MFQVKVHAADGVHIIAEEVHLQEAKDAALKWLGKNYEEIEENYWIAMYGESVHIKEKIWTRKDLEEEKIWTKKEVRAIMHQMARKEEWHGLEQVAYRYRMMFWDGKRDESYTPERVLYPDPVSELPEITSDDLKDYQGR